jgi:hypothetical protein
MKNEIMQFIAISDHDSLKNYAIKITDMLTPKQMKEIAPMFQMAITFNPDAQAPKKPQRQKYQDDDDEIDMSGMDELM